MYLTSLCLQCFEALQFFILMTDTRGVKRCIIIISHFLLNFQLPTGFVLVGWKKIIIRLRPIQTSRLITFFSQLPLSHWVQSMRRVAFSFLNSVASLLADQSGDDREISFLFQRLSVLIQRYNAILLHDCFVKEEEEWGSFQLDFCTFLYCIA